MEPKTSTKVVIIREVRLVFCQTPAQSPAAAVAATTVTAMNGRQEHNCPAPGKMLLGLPEHWGV